MLLTCLPCSQKLPQDSAQLKGGAEAIALNQARTPGNSQSWVGRCRDLSSLLPEKVPLLISPATDQSGGAGLLAKQHLVSLILKTTWKASLSTRHR